MCLSNNMLWLFLLIALCVDSLSAVPTVTICRYGNTGRCRGYAGNECDPGSTCKPIPDSTGVICCKNRPLVNCQYGKGENCDLANWECKSGYTCTLPTKPFSHYGTCCKDKFKPVECPYGSSDDKCGGKMSLPCGVGYSCKYPGVIDGYGKCCRNQPKQGVCPPSSGMAGTCVFRPEVNCIGHEFCPGDQLCCSAGCNSVCTSVNQIPGCMGCGK